METQQVEHRIFSQIVTYPRCHILDFLHRITNLGNDEVRDFDMHAVYLQLLQRLINRFNTGHGRLRLVEFWVSSTLEVNRRRIQEGCNRLHRLRRHVPVCDERVEETDLPRDFRRLISILHINCWLRVRVAYSLAVFLPRRLHDVAWRKIPSRYFFVLAYHPVVAELAAEVAPRSRDGHDHGSRVEVREGFFADGVDARGHRFPIV